VDKGVGSVDEGSVEIKKHAREFLVTLQRVSSLLELKVININVN
jgi:hypothetical protein